LPALKKIADSADLTLWGGLLRMNRVKLTSTRGKDLFGKVSTLLILLAFFQSPPAIAQSEEEETPNAPLQQNDSPFFDPLTVEDLDDLMRIFERRAYAAPYMRAPGVYVGVDAQGKNYPNGGSEFIREFALSTFIVPNASFSLEISTERQRAFFNFMYVPPLGASSFNADYMTFTFGQDLSVAPGSATYYGVTMGYRFNFTTANIERQRFDEDPENLTLFNFTGFNAELSLGYRPNDSRYMFYLGSGSSSMLSSEDDPTQDDLLSSNLSISYTFLGLMICSPEEFFCPSLEIHSDSESQINTILQLSFRK